MKRMKIQRTIILILSLTIIILAACATGQPEQEQVPTQEPTLEQVRELPPTVPPDPEHSDPNFPPAMIYHSGLYEASEQQILIFGGNSKHGTNGDIKQVFSYDPASGKWGEPLPFDANPPWKNAFPPAYDEESDRVIILNMVGETWAFDYSSNTWENMETTNGPSGRCGHTMVYDSESDVVILYGGFGCNSPMDPPSDEVWAYDYNTNTWTAMNPGPHLRTYHTSVYDSESDRMLMWGGRHHDESSDTSIWAYDYNTDSWTEHPADGGPENRSTYHTMTYIPELDRTIIIGGVVLTSAFGGDFVLDVWEYDFNNNAWMKIETEGDSPPPLAKQVMVYDPGTGLMFMYGGSRDVLYENDYISYEFWSYDPINHVWDNLLSE